MTPAQVRVLLAKISAYDNRQPNEASALAWEETVADIGFAEALAAVASWFKKPDRRYLMPGDIRAEVDQNHDRGHQSAVRIESHCGITSCFCTHDGDCFKGWIDGDTTTRPCPTCRPNLARSVDDVPLPGHRNPADLATLRKP